MFLRAIFDVLVTVFRRAARERVPEAAASMSFYAVFSLFPLLLIVVAIGSRLVESPDAQERLLELLLRLLPVSKELIRENVLAVLRIRGTVGWIGAAGLLWAATRAFSTLVRNLNRAWPNAHARNLLGERLLALAVVGSLVGLVLLYLVAKALVILPGEWQVAQNFAASIVEQVPVPSGVTLFIFILTIITLLYMWLPRTRVLWREALVGGTAATFALAAATTAFTRFLAMGLVRYNVVYGSLGAFLALLSWVYIQSAIVLVGAHLAAAIACHTRAVGDDVDDACDEGTRRGNR